MMELTLDQALIKGIEAHKAGQVTEADRYYTAILKAQPKHPDANHNMGVLAVGIGKIQEALPFFKTALETNPGIAQFWLSYIDALIKLNRMDDAKAVLDEAKSKGVKGDGFDQVKKRLIGLEKGASSKSQEPPKEQLQNLINLYTQGQFQKALNQGLQLLKDFPNSTNLYNIIGAVNRGLGKLDEAIEVYKKALSINPYFAEAHNNLGITFKELSKLNEAEESYNRAIALKPNYVEAHNNLGVILRLQGKLNESKKSFKQAIALKPNYAEVHCNLGITFKELGELIKAETSYKKAIVLKPNYAEAYNNLGLVLEETWRLEEAKEKFNKAISIKKDYAEAYNNLGYILQILNDFDNSILNFEKALAINPNRPSYHNNLGSILQLKGRINEALECFNKAISLKPDYAEAHRHITTIKKYETHDEHYLKMQELYLKKNISKEKLCNINFGLAKACEDLKDYKGAFNHYTQGNKIRKKLINYNINQDVKLFELIKSNYINLTKNSLSNREIAKSLTQIFIVGMPRSGTTLVEQIISTHSQVTAAGELPFVSLYGKLLSKGSSKINKKSILQFRENYLNYFKNPSDVSLIVTDKMPLNFRFIPLICAAFPEAKIVHVQRDASATCWSNYKQYFNSKNIGYCYDLKDVVQYYNLYKDLMRLWQSEYSDRIYHLNYEKLTTDQENQTRKLIKHLELNWEEACLSPEKNKRSVRTASQQQVRKKVYKGSSNAWHKYEQYLSGAFDSLKS